MLEGLRWSDIGMFEIEIMKGGNYWYEEFKDLILGVGGYDRKWSLVIEVVTELRCQYLKLAFVSVGNKISKLFERNEEESKQADLQLDQRRSLGVVY